jgi:glutamate racemase
MKIGVFDSGVGGLSVANAIRRALPGHEIVLKEDREHVPYGTRAPAEILQLILPIFRGIVDEGCEVIVVACNTVTTTLIGELRGRFDIPFIAVEPMVKPATGQTRSKIIAVCATPTTLASKRYSELKKQYAKGIKVLEPDCSDWAYMIEQGTSERAKIDERINEVLGDGADVIVLACTHYHWIEEEIEELAAGRAKVLQPEQAVVDQLKRVIGQRR